jgi:hypothetical protein
MSSFNSSTNIFPWAPWIISCSETVNWQSKLNVYWMKLTWLWLVTISFSTVGYPFFLHLIAHIIMYKLPFLYLTAVASWLQRNKSGSNPRKNQWLGDPDGLCSGVESEQSSMVQSGILMIVETDHSSKLQPQLNSTGTEWLSGPKLVLSSD